MPQVMKSQVGDSRSSHSAPKSRLEVHKPLASFSWDGEDKVPLTVLAKGNDILEHGVIHWDTPVAKGGLPIFDVN
jgi:hypothetical protein